MNENIISGKADRQVLGMICRMGPFGIYQMDRECLPDEWKDKPGQPAGSCDFRLENLALWIMVNLEQKPASALVSSLMAGNMGGAKEILRSAGCPLKDSVTSA